MSARTTDNPLEFSVCMAMDAFRLCMGQKPKHFTAEEVIRWIGLVSEPHP